MVYLKTFVLPSSSKRSRLWEVTTDSPQFYQDSLGFSVTRTMLGDLEKLYWKGIDKKELTFDQSTKRWSHHKKRAELIRIEDNENDMRPASPAPPSLASKVKDLFSWFKKDDERLIVLRSNDATTRMTMEDCNDIDESSDVSSRVVF